MRHLKARGEIAALLLAAAAAALVPFMTRSNVAAASAPFPGWPTQYEGRALSGGAWHRLQAMQAREQPQCGNGRHREGGNADPFVPPRLGVR